MITRRHDDGTRRSSALFSDCGAYRYGLRRRWADGPSLLYVMLIPSTADERRNDPTIERCERRARALGFGALSIANLFAFRATDPRDLKRAAEPVGAENDALLLDWHRAADMTLAAWGVHGAHLGRHRAVLSLLDGPLHHLGLTRGGLPRHPLYVAYAARPEPWDRTP